MCRIKYYSCTSHRQMASRSCQRATGYGALKIYLEISRFSESFIDIYFKITLFQVSDGIFKVSS